MHYELLCARRPKQEHAERFVYNYRKTDFTHQRHLLHCSPLSILIDTTGIDEGFDLFYDFMYAAINADVSTLYLYHNDMISSLKDNANAHKTWTRSHSLIDCQVFSELRTNFKKFKREENSIVTIYHKSNNQLSQILNAYSVLPKASKRM